MLMTNGFVGSKTDPPFFIYSHGLAKFFILIYVNDIIITGNSLPHIARVIHALSFIFSIMDCGPPHYFLGIDVISRGDGLILT